MKMSVSMSSTLTPSRRARTKYAMRFMCISIRGLLMAGGGAIKEFGGHQENGMKVQQADWTQDA